MKTRSARSPRPPVETADYLAMLRRIVRAAGPHVGEADVDDLATFIAIRDDLDAAIVVAVRHLRESGHTWQDIGTAVGTTRQAALMRWSPQLK